MEVYDEVENVWALSGHLPKDDSAPVPGGPGHVVRIELFFLSQSIENDLTASWWTTVPGRGAWGVEEEPCCSGRVRDFMSWRCFD